MRPLADRLLGVPHAVCHCLLLVTEEGLVLVDSGIGLADTAAPDRLGAGFVRMMRPRLDPAETAVRRIAALGYRPADVRHVVLTHLDPDHAGGIADFPGATVHVTAAEYRAATAAERYRRRQWAHGTRWRLHEGHGLVRVPGHGRRRGCSDGDVPRWSR